MPDLNPVADLAELLGNQSPADSAQYLDELDRIDSAGQLRVLSSELPPEYLVPGDDNSEGWMEARAGLRRKQIAARLLVHAMAGDNDGVSEAQIAAHGYFGPNAMADLIAPLLRLVFEHAPELAEQAAALQREIATIERTLDER